MAYMSAPTWTDTAEAGRPQALKEATAQLNRRIVLVACVVVAELWALTAALKSWAAGETAQLGWILAFQLACFLLALIISGGGNVESRPLPQRSAGARRLGPPQPAGD